MSRRCMEEGSRAFRGYQVQSPPAAVHDTLFRPEVRKASADLAQGWPDAVRHLHPDERIYTFWRLKLVERDAGLRIDHFLLSPAVAP